MSEQTPNWMAYVPFIVATAWLVLAWVATFPREDDH